MSGVIVHGGGIGAAAALYGGRVEGWLDLSTGLNPCPPTVPDVSTSAWQRLPDQHLLDEVTIAARDFYRSGEILPLAVPGTQAAIQMLPRLVPAGARVAILSPTYGEYARVFALVGVAVDAIAGPDDVREDHALVVAVNPNNPDGRLLSRDVPTRLAAGLAGRGGYLVVDEAFSDCTPETSVVDFVAGTPNLIVFRSFGKFFGMAGIRLGFVIAVPEMRERMATWLGPWAVSGPALSVAAALFRGDADAIRRRLAERRTALQRMLSGAGLHIAGGTALFALVEDPHAEQLHTHLCRAHILTRKFDYAPTWLRIGLAPDEAADARLAAALSTWSGR